MPSEDKKHLAGNIAGGNPLSIYPEMWKTWKADSILDIGCGDGSSMAVMREILPNAAIHGVDGGHENVRLAREKRFLAFEHDFTTGLWDSPREYAIGWCCEVVEHIEERFINNLAPTFLSCRYLFVTHALPGQGGYHHVNCQLPPYWEKYFESIGFDLLPGKTLKTRWLCPADTYFFRTGLVFERMI
jgi:hypothetical protein